MASFTLRAILTGGTFTHSYGISSFAVASFQGELMLYSGSATDAGLSAFHLEAGLAAALSSEITGTSASGTLGVADMEVTDIGGAPVITPAGRYDDAFSYLRLNMAGDFVDSTTVPPIPQSTAALTDLEILKIGTDTFMIAGRDNAAGLDVFSLTTSYGLSHVSSLVDDIDTTLANVSDLVKFNNGTSHLLFATSSIEHGITSMSIDSSGNLTVVDVIDGMKGYGIYQASRVATVEVGNKDFLIVGASGSNNLTVFEIGLDGDLIYRDMVWDSLDTRFRGVTALETISLGDRAFALVGGSDGGLSLFEIGTDGRLYFMTNVVDTAATTLASVSAIKVVDVGGDLQVFVSGATESGITQFSLDLGAIGSTLTPSGPSSTAIGSPGDDFLMGDDTRNSLWGMSGNDRIVDGAGIDSLFGGAGADVFVFVADGMYDRIMDYQPGIDRIDLSDFDRLYSIASLQIVPTVYGARIEIGSDAILLETLSGQSLTAADFSSTSFIF
ncbi:MAG: hypothetical protein B7Z02_12760 [Rhodobacterales bacterium 32-67-9]|nr:MAG: hypothetical protein B7Z02_12760 [Rhodobacterales bacterium 32-67-9]